MTKLNYQELIEKLDQDIQKSNKNRYFIAISGPPASGKSTTSEKLHSDLTLKRHKPSILQMDGFHYDNSILKEKDLIQKKVEEKDQKSITDTKNKDRSLRERSIVGINLVSGFKYIEDVKELSGGRIYDPGRGRTFKSNIYLLENGNLKVEGCLLNVCGHEEWKPLNVTMNDDGTMNFELR